MTEQLPGIGLPQIATVWLETHTPIESVMPPYVAIGFDTINGETRWGRLRPDEVAALITRLLGRAAQTGPEYWLAAKAAVNAFEATGPRIRPPAPTKETA